jgi:glyoxylase-like metal-dependent hydrolase (beta-lactamase superfamily II)
MGQEAHESAELPNHQQNLHQMAGHLVRDARLATMLSGPAGCACPLSSSQKIPYMWDMNQISAIHEVHTPEFSVRGVLITGRRFSLVWDTLTHPRDMADFAKACGQRPCFVVYSHADWDHIQGTAGLGSRLVIGHRECLRRFETEAPRILACMQSSEPGKWDDVTLVPPDITFDRHLDLELGDMRVGLHPLPGHTPDSIVAFIPSMKLLLAGDAAELPCPSVPPGCDLKAWIRGLEGWRDHPGVRTVLPAHGPSGNTDILGTTIAYLRGLHQGTPLPMPLDMPPFYVRTHQENLRNVGLTSA